MGEGFYTVSYTDGGKPAKLEAAREAQAAGIEHYGVLTGNCGVVFVIPLEPDESDE